MSNVTIYELAQVAEAAYANLVDSTNTKVIDALKDDEFLGTVFSTSQAEKFVGTWEVIQNSYQPDTGTGFSATLFRHRDSGEYTLGIRGTMGYVDLVEEDIGNIVADGMAFDQALDLYNYWQKITHLGNYQAAKLVEVQPPEGLTYEQKKEWAHGQGYLFDITIAHEKIYAVEFETRSDGLGLISDSQQVHVTGHSLGGHLAAAFSRLFPANTLDVTMINGAGFGAGAFYLPQAGSAAANMDVFNFFSALGCTVAFDAGKITNLVGTAGWDLTSQDSWLGLQQPGSVRDIETENWSSTTFGHGAAQMTDTLAVMGMLYRLDNRLQIPALNQLLLAAGSENERQLEDVVNAMARAFGVSVLVAGVDNLDGGREDLYAALKAIGEQAGNDLFRSGAANDTVIGGTGQDRGFGQAGNDRLYGDNELSYDQAFAANELGNGITAKGDLPSGNAGTDFVVGSVRNDLLLGGSERDDPDALQVGPYASGVSVNDALYGGVGNDERGSGLAFCARAKQLRMSNVRPDPGVLFGRSAWK